MHAPWMWVANYFRELSQAHGSVEMAKVREVIKLAGGSRWIMLVSRWDAAFVSACLRLSGYACPATLDVGAYRAFGEPLGGEPRRGCIVVIEDQVSIGGNTRVGFLENALGEELELLEAGKDGVVEISRYDRDRVVDCRWPTETAALPQLTSLPTIAAISPENSPLHVKFAQGTVNPLYVSEFSDFVYLDRTSGTVDPGGGLAAEETLPVVIESVVIGPAVRPSIGQHGLKIGATDEFVRPGRAKRMHSRLFGGISGIPAGDHFLAARVEGPAARSPLLFGTEVAALQNALTVQDLYLGEIDGVFGHRTRDAVLSIQSQSGLPRTGIADDKTWKTLSVGTLRLPHIEFSAETTSEQSGLAQVSSGATRAPSQEGGGSSDLGVTQVYFATTRRPAGDNNSTDFTDERRRELAFGSIAVNVPPIELREIGTIRKPAERKFIGWTIWRESEDKNKHFFVKNRARLTRREFCEAVSGNTSGQALVFVHGFNTTFDDGAFRLAQIASDLQFEGTRILFSWPSRGGVLAYMYDRESAMFSREAFLDLLNILQTDTRLTAIHVIAHSMGNQIVVDALATLGRSLLSRSLAEVILAAPDIDRDVFCDLGGRIKALARGVTLYASSSDRALQLSRRLAQFPRAGDVPEQGPVVVQNVETIDASSVGSELLSLNHSKYATDRSLMDDLNRLIRFSDRPPNTRSTQIIGVPTLAAPAYWRYR